MNISNSMDAVERSLTHGSRWLIGGLISAVASGFAALTHQISIVAESEDVDIATPIGIDLPADQAAFVFLLVTVASSIGAWLSLTQTRDTIRRIFLSKESEDDNTWMVEMQTRLSGCPAHVTSTATVITICVLTHIFFVSTLLLLFGPTSFLQFIIASIVFQGVGAFPYILVIFGGWLDLFNPNAYDMGSRSYLSLI
jgi:hypothetical protein